MDKVDLNKKAWWRFLKVVYIAVWLLAIFIVGVIAYFELPYSEVSYYWVGFKCNNGESWNFRPSKPVYVLDDPDFSDDDEENARKTCVYGGEWMKNKEHKAASLPDKNYTLHHIYDNYGSSERFWWTAVIGFAVIFIMIETIKSAALYVMGLPIYIGMTQHVMRLLKKIFIEEDPDKRINSIPKFLSLFIKVLCWIFIASIFAALFNMIASFVREVFNKI